MHALYDKILWAYQHRKEIGAGFMAALIAWTPLATFLARVIKRPPPAATWWKRACYDLFIDTPSWTAALGHSGVFGGVFNLPGVPSRRAESNPTPAASKMMRQLGKENSNSVGPPPPPWRGDNDSPLLVLLVVGALGMAIAASGCAGLGACELNTLPKTVEKAILSVAVAAMSPAGVNWEQQLDQAALDAVPGQGACVVQAVETQLEQWMSKKGEPAPAYVEARRRLQSYLSKHAPTACAPVQRRGILLEYSSRDSPSLFGGGGASYGWAMP